MPGMLAGSRLSTFSVASVPPVEAPRPMTVCSGAPSPPKRSGAAGAAGWGRLARDNLAWEATIILWVRAWRKDSRLSTASGLRTKSTAPAASASKTRRLREETRMTGRGCDGRNCFKKSMPLMPGISTSSVITSGERCWSFVFASMALTAYPTTSMRGEAESPWMMTLRATAESSTTKTRIFRFVVCISTGTFLCEIYWCVPSGSF